ncbi:hypothetical protein Aperf_G00000120707 [Anoplocephala perfoliata]
MRVMTQYVSFAALKVMALGFLCGMMGSWIFTSSAKYFQQPHFTVPRFHDEHSGHHEGETVLVDRLAKQMPIMAFIFTSEKAKISKASLVKSMWARRFNRAIFLSDAEDTTFPTVALPPADGWSKTRSAISYIHEKYAKMFTFFMKAQDTNYIVVENLRELLRTMNPDEPLLIGRQMESEDGNAYMSDDSGYVISRSGLENLATGIRNDVEACKANDAPAEKTLSKCAEAVGVKLVHALDEAKLDYFHPFPPREFFSKFVKDKYPGQTVFEPSQMRAILTACSNHSVSFFDVHGPELYSLEYTTYHLYPYGIIRDPENYQKVADLLPH